MASAKADDRGPAGAKRLRNDAPRSEGDWTCPQCGNVNFSFRIVCNRSKCGAPRSSPSPNIRNGPPPGHFNHPPYYLGGVVPPPPMPFGMPAGYRVPVPYMGLRYDYGPSASSPGPYGFPHGYGPPSPIGGMGYGHDRGMNGYGYGFHGSPLPVAIPSPWTGRNSPDDAASRKRRGGPDGSAEGDWKCLECGNVNFAFRTSCNIKKCGTPRPTTALNQAASGNKDSTNAPEGSWVCDKCGNLNYPFRTVCNRKGCGADKPSEGDQ